MKTCSDCIPCLVTQVRKCLRLTVSDEASTYLPACSPSFREAFAAADLIISKGQGNFETVHTETKTIFALFMVKCPVVAATTGLPLGTKALLRTGDPTTRKVFPHARQ